MTPAQVLGSVMVPVGLGGIVVSIFQKPLGAELSTLEGAIVMVAGAVCVAFGAWVSTR